MPTFGSTSVGAGVGAGSPDGFVIVCESGVICVVASLLPADGRVGSVLAGAAAGGAGTGNTLGDPAALIAVAGTARGAAFAATGAGARPVGTICAPSTFVSPGVFTASTTGG